jgi:hypothetical protein
MNCHEGRRVRAMRRSAKAAPTALDMFWACCKARAHLYAVGELDLHDAVDVLQEHAVRHGLVAEMRTLSRRSLPKRSTARGSWPS